MSFEVIDDILKIKPVVELKEDNENHVYKADFRGHLQLVNIAEDIPAPCNTAEINRADPTDQWKGIKPSHQSSDEDHQVIIAWQEESTNSFSTREHRQLKNVSGTTKTCIKKELVEQKPHDGTFDCSFPEIYDYSSESAWEQHTDNSDHSISSDFSITEDLVILTQAEKKRLYRMRIKEENPALWSTIKEREATRKRELREKRRSIIYEMQKAMEVTFLPDSPEFSNNQLYLEALKERYPDIWNQLVKAVPDTEKRNERLFYERSARSNRRNGPKPTRMYKDVIEAQKKRLYRQKLKEERPEMYERQKARDAYARSIQRLLLKNNEQSSMMGYYTERQFSDVEMHHLQSNNPQDLKSDYISMHSKDKIPNDSAPGVTIKEFVPSTFTTAFPPRPVTETALNPAAVRDNSKNNSSRTCDNEQEKVICPSEISSNSSDNLPNIYTEPRKVNQGSSSIESTTASTTQSNMLWYWNDLKSESPCENTEVSDWTTRQSPRDLTEEQRLKKIERERMHLKEKRKRYRLAMSPERRAEFLKSERERLKKYRIKKKVDDVCLDET